MRTEPYSLKFVPDHLKTRDMCDEAVGRYAYTLKYVSDNLKTQRMCERAIEKRPMTAERRPLSLQDKENV